MRTRKLSHGQIVGLWDVALQKSVTHANATDQAKVVDHVVRAKQAVKDATTELKLTSDTLFREYATPFYSAGARDGAFVKSFDLAGLKTAGVKVVYQDRFSPLKLKSIDEMEAKVAELKQSKVGEFFEHRFDLQLKDNSPEAMAVIAKLMGDQLRHYFNVVPMLAPIKGMDKTQWGLPEQIRKHYCFQYTPSIRILGEKDEEDES